VGGTGSQGGGQDIVPAFRGNRKVGWEAGNGLLRVLRARRKRQRGREQGREQGRAEDEGRRTGFPLGHPAYIPQHVDPCTPSLPQLTALLHGHSYTAYPIGCAAAAASLRLLGSPQSNANLCVPAGWVGAAAGSCPRSPQCDRPCGRLRPLFDEQQVRVELLMSSDCTWDDTLGMMHLGAPDVQ
jgi:hypothetical protein